MLIPINGNIILKEVKEKKIFKGIIIPQQIAANQITFAKVIKLPKKELNTKELKEGDFVVLGYSPVWEKKFKHNVNGEDLLIVNEYAILAIINDSSILSLVDIGGLE